MAPAHRARWDRERTLMRSRWGAVLDTDPFYHPGLALDALNRHFAKEPRLEARP
jgi:hypothetical protein